MMAVTFTRLAGAAFEFVGLSLLLGYIAWAYVYSMFTKFAPSLFIGSVVIGWLGGAVWLGLPFVVWVAGFWAVVYAGTLRVLGYIPRVGP